MKRATKLTLIATSALILISSVTACHHNRTPEERAEWIVEKVSDELELNETQQTNLKNLSNDFLNARKSMKQQHGSDHDRILSLLEQPTLDQNEILSMVQSRTQSINDHAPGIVSSVTTFYNSLNQNQQVMIREHIKEHEEDRGHWNHHSKF